MSSKRTSIPEIRRQASSSTPFGVLQNVGKAAADLIGIDREGVEADAEIPIPENELEATDGAQAVEADTSLPAVEASASTSTSMHLRGESSFSAPPVTAAPSPVSYTCVHAS